jgi:hypothetical protein
LPVLHQPHLVKTKEKENKAPNLNRTQKLPRPDFEKSIARRSTYDKDRI